MVKTPEQIATILKETIPSKVSRNEFSRLTGINRHSIDMWMAGVGEPTAKSLQRLANYFGCPFSITVYPDKNDKKPHIRTEYIP